MLAIVRPMTGCLSQADENNRPPAGCSAAPFCSGSFGTAAQPPGPVQELALVAGTPSGQPQLAVGADGRVVLSWLEKIGEPSNYAFKFAVREGDRWTAPRTIVERDNFFVNWADVPSVFPMRAGGLVAHWLQKNGQGTYAYDVRLSVSDNDTARWGSDRTPYTDVSQTEHGFATFFDWPGGGTGVVWLDGREMTGGGGHDGHAAGAMTLRAARVTPDGTVSDEAKIDGRVCECCPTAAVATARGALVAYRDRSDTEVRDIAVMRLEEGKWHGPTYVHADNWQINACPSTALPSPRWATASPLPGLPLKATTPRAMVAFSSDGGKTFGKPVRVDDAQTLGRVDAVMLEDGRAVVSWLEFMPGASEFRARIVSPDGTREPAFTHHRVHGRPSGRLSADGAPGQRPGLCLDVHATDAAGKDRGRAVAVVAAAPSSRPARPSVQDRVGHCERWVLN